MKTIYLRDFKEHVRFECIKKYSNSISFLDIDSALTAQIQNNLHYHNGKTFDNENGVIAEYCNQIDIPKYENDSDCAKHEFVGIVMNSASRLSRGYTAI
jgi:hypothetical protein